MASELTWLVGALVVMCSCSVGFALGLVWGTWSHIRRRQEKDAHGWRS